MPIGPYLGALGAGIAQGENTGYQQSLDQYSTAAAGRGLALLQQLSQQQQAPPPPMGPPQGQPPPQQMPMGGGMPSQPSALQTMGGPPPGLPPMPQGSPPMGAPPMGGPVGAPAPQPPMRGPMGQPGNMQPPMQPPQGGQGQMQPQGWGQQGGQQGGPLDWRTLIMAVQRGNPGAPPQVLFGAVNKLVPLMNSQSQLEWRQMQAQNYGHRTDVQQEGIETRAQTAEDAIGARRDIAAGQQATTQRGQDIKAQTAADNRISRETIATAGIEGRRAMFEAGLITKMQMDEANRNERGRESDQRAGVQREGIETRAQTAREAEAGRTHRAELSNATKQELGKLSIEARREIAAAGEAGKDYRTSYQEGARTQRAQLSADTRKEIEGMSVTARKELTEYVEGGRMERSEQARTSRENVAAENRGERAREANERTRQTAASRDSRIYQAGENRAEKRREFDIREHRLQTAQVVKQDQAWTRLGQQRQQLERQIKEGGQKQLVTQWRTILDAQHKRAMEVISSYAQMNQIPEETRKQLVDDANAAYEAAIKSIGPNSGGKPTP